MMTFTYSVTRNRRGPWAGYFTLSWSCGDRAGGCCALATEEAGHAAAVRVKQEIGA